MICSFNSGNDNVVSGGEVTFTVTKPPVNNKWSFHGSSFQTQLSIEFSISKMDCDLDDDEIYFTQHEQSDLMRWLQKTDGFRWLGFDQDGFEDVWYNVQINPRPHYFGGRVVGFDCTCLCDSPYGYSPERCFTKILAVNGTTPIFIDHSDIPGEIHPEVTIKANGNGNIQLRTGVCKINNNHEFSSYISSRDTIINSVTQGTEITLNEDYGLVTGFNDLTNFNFNFPFIGNSYESNYNMFKNLSDMSITITVKYRMIRRVYV